MNVSPDVRSASSDQTENIQISIIQVTDDLNTDDPRPVEANLNTEDPRSVEANTYVTGPSTSERVTETCAMGNKISSSELGRLKDNLRKSKDRHSQLKSEVKELRTMNKKLKQVSIKRLYKCIQSYIIYTFCVC